VAAKTLPIGSPAATIPQNRKHRNVFRASFIKNPPFILEKRQILLQGSLFVWMDKVVRKIGQPKVPPKVKEFLWK
jgi:hypothetical protein